MKEYDIAIIGAGPAGLFSAWKLIHENKKLNILIIEKGKGIEERKCPAIEKKTNCLKCKSCSIMSGIGGCGSFSDFKLPITNDFGGYLWKKIGKEKSIKLQKKVDDINFELFCKANSLSAKEGKEKFPKIYTTKDTIYKKICTQHNLHLLEADIRHLGTDIGQIIYKELYKELVELGIEFKVNTEAKKIIKKENFIIIADDEYAAKKIIIAAGRSGSSWVKEICKDLSINTKSNKVDIGVRFECPDEIWSHITKELYESKIIYRTKTYNDEVRTFCMNPSGEVVTENTNGLITVNGHAYEDKSKKTSNTNFALLVSQTFTEPFNDSNEYGNAIIKLSNMLGGGVIVQRFGDLIRGRRSTSKKIEENTLIPTLKAEPGDLSLVLPKRILDDIIEMIEQLDHLVPGMTNDDNLLYGVELKAYDNIVDVNEHLEALKDLYIIGDCSSWSHSLSQAAASGLFVADDIIEGM